MRIAIIGAGMSGTACARALADAGQDIVLLEKSRGPGGRMSTRRMAGPQGDLSFDHGAPCFTASDPRFRAAVADWERRGIVRSWPGAGYGALVGVPGMNALPQDLAAGLELHRGFQASALTRVGEEWQVTAGDGTRVGPFDIVVLATPAEQATPFLSLHDFAMARVSLASRSQPCWTAMMAFDEPLATSTVAIRHHGILSFAGRNNAKFGRAHAETWVVQANPQWSVEHLEVEQDFVLDHLHSALQEALELLLPRPTVCTAHRWRYALSSGTGHDCLWRPDTGLGVCGDWLIGSDVESAWLSGTALAARILETVAAGRIPA